MRRPRILADPSEGASYYHLVTRALEGRVIFDEAACEKFRGLLHAYCEMMGIELLTWCCLTDHFHLLVRTPNAEAFRARVDDEDLLRRLALVTTAERILEMRETLEQLREGPADSRDDYQTYRQKLLERLGDVSIFMRELKQRFTQWYNRRENRRGPLWEDRFKSVLIEEYQEILITVAAYVDLNPVRAGLVKDPKDYRWCGYAEAVAGRAESRRGIQKLFVEDSKPSWKNCEKAYRRLLAAEGERVRYFTQGLALGRKDFIEKVFERNRPRMQVKRKVGARKPKGTDLGEWRTLVDLRSERNDRSSS